MGARDEVDKWMEDATLILADGEDGNVTWKEEPRIVSIIQSPSPFPFNTNPLLTSKELIALSYLHFFYADKGRFDICDDIHKLATQKVAYPKTAAHFLGQGYLGDEVY